MFATDARIAEKLLRVHIGDAAILHSIVGVGKRCLFCTREAVYLITYRRPLLFLTPRETALRIFPLAQVADLVVEERGDGTVCRLGIATSAKQLPPDGRVPDDQSLLFVTLLAPRYRDILREIKYLVDSLQFRASWEAAGKSGA